MEARFGPTDVKWSFKISNISAGFVKELSPLFSSHMYPVGRKGRSIERSADVFVEYPVRVISVAVLVLYDRRSFLFW